MERQSWSSIHLLSSLILLFLARHSSSAPTAEQLVAIDNSSTTTSATVDNSSSQSEITTETTLADLDLIQAQSSTTALPGGDVSSTESNPTGSGAEPGPSSSTSGFSDDTLALESKHEVTEVTTDEVVTEEPEATPTSQNIVTDELPGQNEIAAGFAETTQVRASTTFKSFPVWKPAAATTSTTTSTTQRPSTTVSGLEWFANTPIEGLINATTLAREDLTTLATLLFDRQTTTVATTTTSEEWPNVHNPFFFDRRSPGSTCVHKGRQYANGQSLDQEDPCHFCVCVNGYVDCYWKNCPPAPEGCLELDYEGVCARSLYLCSIPKKGEPLPFSVNKRKRRDLSYPSMTCDILGVVYKVGELVGVASDPCMECRCALDSLYCSPKCCFNPSEVASDPAKNSRSNDVVQWQPVLSHPLKHLRYDFQNL